MKSPKFEEIEVAIDGFIYRGDYSVSDGLVTVKCTYGRKSAVPGASGAPLIAQLLLQELVHEAIRAGHITSRC